MEHLVPGHSEHFINKLMELMGEGLERVKGIEPSSKAWEAFVLPLNHTRIPDLNKGFARCLASDIAPS